jgi:hypothetical protein
MTPAIDDDALGAAFEACLAGRGASPADGGLAAFADGVRATAARPPVPSAALAELLATGLLTDQSRAAAAPAPAPRRRSPRMFVTLVAKFASAGLAVKSAAVAGVVVVGVSTAGFTHELPGPVQTGFDQVVTHEETAEPSTDPTPTVDPTPTADPTPSGEPTATQTPITTTTAEPSEGDQGGEQGDGDQGTVPAQKTPGGTNGLGGTVSSLAHQGGTAGGAASTLAHQRNEARRSAGATTAPTGPTTGSDDATAKAGDDDAPEEAGDDSGSGSHGGRGSH